MTTSSGISASMASMMASLANSGGTKAIDTSAPVSFIASATLPNTGSSTSLPSLSTCDTVVPALRALTPPTTWVPALSISAVCLVPSPPVMPWTMTLLSLFRKIDIVHGVPYLLRQLGGLVGAGVHGVGLDHQRMVGLGEDAAALLDVVAVEPDDQRLVGLVAEHLQRLDDAVGDRVARGDAAEHVDEHALDLAVAEDDVQPGGHHLGRGAAADVEEVGRLDAAVLLAGVGDDVQRGHDQARAVADDADLAVELDVVEVVLLGLELQRVGGVAVLELGVAGLPEVGVGVEGDLAVQRQDLVVGGAHQRVDLDQGGVLADEDLPQLLDGHRGGVEHLGGQVALLGDGARERQVDTLDGVDGHLGEPLGLGGGDLFDLHAALDRAHRQVGAVGAVEQEGDVVLLGDVAGLGDQQLLDDVALDVQAEDVLGVA